MLKVIMIRHGKTYGNTLGRYIGITDEPLLEEEKEDLKQYAFEHVDAVFSSPLKRCVETAEILFPGMELNIIPELRECNFGEFENKNYQELSDNENYQAWVDSGGQLAFPGGEDRGLFQKRCIAGFDEIIRRAAEEEWESIALTVHGGTIMAILDRYGIPKADYFDWHVKNGEGYYLRVNTEQYFSGKKEVVVSGTIRRWKKETEADAVHESDRETAGYAVDEEETAEDEVDGMTEGSAEDTVDGRE